MSIGIREIDEKYEVLEKLGEGGMGAVYLAKHRLLDERRVIKTIKPDLVTDGDLQKRFLREARVAAKLRHPHIASVHDFAFTEEDIAYIVMAFIEGRNLREFQRAGGRLSVGQVIDISQQALDALAYLHDQGFVHRDISSDNMMLGRQDGDLESGRGKPWVTLIDLGLAKHLETSNWNTKTGMVVGKVRYISPEQLNAGIDGVVIDARSDLYSYGVVLYELLTSEYPITGDDDVSLIAGHLYREPRPFDETDPQSRIPERLRSVVLKALQKDPTRRWQSARDLADALERCRSPEATVEILPGAATSSAPESMEPTEPIGAGTLRDGAGRQTVDVRHGLSTRPTGGAVAEDSRRTLPVDLEAETAPIQSEILRQAEEAKPSRGATRWLLVAALLAVVAGAGWWLVRSLSGGDDAAGGTAQGVTATDPGAGGQGGTAELTVADLPFGSFHALVIGNNDYERLPDLASAQVDARDLGALLAAEYGYEVEVLENATREQIVNALVALQRRLSVRDSLLVYYAGHGQVDGKSRYWQPVEAHPTQNVQWISTEYDVRPLLDGMAARHVLVISDSCFAGDDLPPEEVEPAASVEEVRQRLTRISRMVLTSGGDRPVVDQGTGRHSIFSQALLDVLRSRKSPLSSGDLFGELVERVGTAAERIGLEQTPTLQPIPQSIDEGGEFYFVPASDDA